MRKTLLAMADGKFAYEQDELIISESRLEFICNSNQSIEGKFTIQSSQGTLIKGILYTTNYRMQCTQTQFMGKKVELEYRFNSDGLSDMSTVKGDIYIETNIGEYNLPFVVSVLNEPVSSSLGAIRNMFHFTNLARADFEQAYKLFASRKFKDINMEPDERMYYNMLSKTNMCREHLEEFLLAINKKKPVSINLEENNFEAVYSGENFSKNLTITKKGWGYLKIDVTSDSDFVKIEKPKITMEDFVGDRLDYALIIDGEKLHSGNNYARIKFSTFVQEECYEITVKNPENERTENLREIEELRCNLCQLYIQVRTHAIHNMSWVRESRNTLERLMSVVPENNLLKLFHAHLLVLDKKKEDAEFILDGFKKNNYIRRQEPEVYAYLLYVEALIRQQNEFTEKAVAEVKILLDKHPHSAKIFWALMFLDDELQNNPSKKYRMLNEQFVYGCRSPFLYLETFLLLKTDPALITNISAFEKQVLGFALHQGLITEELAQHAAEVSLLCKDYDVLLTRILKNCYTLFGNTKIIEAVCSQLIKGGFRDKDNFYWYELGVNSGLKLNLLYEHYLYTVPLDKKDMLPKQLILYFAYNQHIDYRHKAFLYANVTKFKNEFVNIYDKYEPSISLFVEEQLMKKRVTEDLIYLYEEHMDVLVQKKEYCEILEELIFSCVVKCQHDKAQRVIVGYQELSEYDEYIMTDKKAYVRIYTDAAFVAVQDLNARLHFETVDFSIKPLLTRSKITRYAAAFEKKTVGLLLNRYKKSGIILETDGVTICHRLLRQEHITDKFKEELLGKLIKIFEERYDEEAVVNLLCKLNFDVLDSEKRAEYIGKMVTYGMYDEAYELVFKYGFEHINLKRLVRLCSRKISSGCDEERLLMLSAYVFISGKYDEVMLNYLVGEFCGTTYDMIKLWTAAKNFDLDSYKISERLLIQMLYTGFMPGKTVNIFEDYCAHGAKPEVVMAYISYLSYQYVVNDQVVEDLFFDYILKLFNRGEMLNDSAKIAFVKYCSGKENLDESQTILVEEAVNFLEKKGIRFSFFNNAKKIAGINSDLYDKTVIEHLANPSKKIRLYYRILDGSMQNTEFITEELKPMLGPFFSKEIALFFGEMLQYYITEQEAGKEESVVSSALINKEPDEPEELNGIYGWINEMYLTLSLKDEISFMDLLNKFRRNQVIAEKLFELKE